MKQKLEQSPNLKYLKIPFMDMICLKCRTKMLPMSIDLKHVKYDGYQCPDCGAWKYTKEYKTDQEVERFNFAN